MGRHPFIGRYTGRGDMPPEKAIAEHRFAYAPNQLQTQMQPPPGTVGLDAFGLSIAAHFTRLNRMRWIKWMMIGAATSSNPASRLQALK